MNVLAFFPSRNFKNLGLNQGLRIRLDLATALHCPGCRRQISASIRNAAQPVDSPEFVSIVDRPSVLVRAGRKKHGPGLIILALIPITAFALGTWQVQRLNWKTGLIAKFEDRLVRPPLPLPPKVDPEAIHDFDYRRIYAKGQFCHDKEMLIGPRIQEGKDGFLVITPLERPDSHSSVLVNRGWIDKKFKDQNLRDPELGCPQGEVVVEGLLREPFKKNMFTPDNTPEQGKFYFPDVKQMAELAGSQPVWIEETMKILAPDLLASWERESKGIPIGRAPEVNLKNNHAQYIFTWYALSLATSVMLWMVVRKPPPDIARRVRQSQEWS
ncbi:Cytochrome oxidase assembly protein shy1 [Golovinomyces cichoracearum]|uniref:SURF1-like protein n=1 Tax=Golovinomyces cichoracearum TaxID=62708 RepID=A0A420IJZ6_9PEZI|nr:Cytochrome oxidase assembly protein shy1 [Golovinomyces cichoracearum]